MKRILVYGYGNPGRQDDCLANELVEIANKWVKKNGIKNVDFDSNYQLNIEDAELISHYDIVIFADASQEHIDDFYLSKVDPNNAKVEFSMHAVSPEYVLDLCNKMYNKTPETYLLHIKGYEWEFMCPMSDHAKENLEKAFSFLKYKILIKSEE
jgi:hydrogenase maturation protease